MPQFVGYPLVPSNDGTVIDTVRTNKSGPLFMDSNGNQYRYVKNVPGAVTLVVGDVVKCIQGPTILGFTDIKQTEAADADKCIPIGVAMSALAAGNFGYILASGAKSAKISGSVTFGQALELSNTVGAFRTKNLGDCLAGCLESATAPALSNVYVKLW